MALTLVGRYKSIMSVSLAVVEALGMPFNFPPNPFVPLGESISIGVEAMVMVVGLRAFLRFQIFLCWTTDHDRESRDFELLET